VEKKREKKEDRERKELCINRAHSQGFPLVILLTWLEKGTVDQRVIPLGFGFVWQRMAAWFFACTLRVYVQVVSPSLFS
jgi:hypothetical protein